MALGQAIAGDGDAVGEFSFSEEGACINESRELPAALGVGVGVRVRLASAFAGLGSSGVASMRVEGDFSRGLGVASIGGGDGDGFRRGLRKLNNPFFFGFSGSIVACAVAPEAFSSNLPFTIVPETRLETL